MTMLLSLCLAVCLDYLFKEPTRFHPLVGFGKWAGLVEAKLNHPSASRWQGILAWAITVLTILIPVMWLFDYLKPAPLLETLLGGLMLYLCIGWQSLLIHAKAISVPLEQGDMTEARLAVSRIISRDTDEMQPVQVAAAATESVLENGADAIFSTLFWFALLGPIGAVGYRLSNTLDAMWGYKNSRFLTFGWAAARIDDVLNFFPARLTALSYALVGNFKTAMAAWQAQAHTWKSPNAGPVMAAGAGAINAKLGGGATYHGQWQDRPILGVEIGQAPTHQTILAACALVNRALILWLLALGTLALIGGAISL